jgi:multiple sugar transport system substrate-binding protein
MLMLLKEQLANPTVLTNDATAVKDEFISGQAAFTSNWLFQCGYLDDPNTSDIVEQAKVALLPASEDVQAESVSVSASQGLAISAASEHPELAWQWIAFFTSPLVQRAFRYEMPIWTSVQTSPDLLMFDSLMPLKRKQLTHVVHRPNVPYYQEASAILQEYLHLALQGRMKPSTALEEAQTEIEAVFAAAETDLPAEPEPAPESETK